MLFIGCSVLTEDLFSRINRGVVGFVVDQEERQPLHYPAPVLILSVCDMMAYPAEQPLQNSFVLLDDKQPGTLFGGYPEGVCPGRAEVAVVGAVGNKVGANGRITVNETNSDLPDIIGDRSGLKAEKPFVE